MCGMCGTPLPPPKWFMVGVEDSPGQVIRERTKQITLLTKHLLHLNIGVHASPSSPGITLKTPDGRAEFVQDIGNVWPAVERLAGRPYNPLLTAHTT